MHRRSFLRLAGSGFAALVGLAGCVRSGPEAEAFARPDLLDLFGNEQDVRALGAAYRAAFPSEDGEDALRAALASDTAAAADLPEALRMRVRQDFEEGRTVELDGWILSVTEARQCALFSLLFA